MLKLIVFDWDDVFTMGSTGAYHACYVKAAKDSGSITEEEEITKIVDELWGRPHEQVIKTYLAKELELFEEVNKKYEEYVHTSVFLDHLSLLEGSIELLNKLKEKYTLAIVSGINPTLLKDKIFPKFNIPNVFSEIVTSYDLDDRNKGKPYPDMLNLVLERLNIKNIESIHVGDAGGDMKMAISAGVTPVAVLTGQMDKQEALSYGIEYIIDDVTDLESILEDIVI